MKIPLSSLKEFLPLTQSPEEIANILNMAGLEVEGVHILGKDFSGVVVAKILSTEKHPNAEKLTIAKVFDGIQELQIVCGATNCRAGLTTALARVGATVRGDKGETITIKKGRLRDVDSFGMLCAAEELGLPFKEEGIMELDDQLGAGSDLKEIIYDAIFDISLTPNLGHCQSVLGVARELSAFLSLPLTLPPSKPVHNRAKSLAPLKVDIRESSSVISYMAAVASEITVGRSPQWLEKQLLLLGQSSINNVVDISNYILHVFGQPLHIYDFNKVKDATLTICQGRNEDVLFLDGMQRVVDSNVLCIYDSNSLQAAAGVMGAKQSSIQDGTKNIIIEAAVFHPAAVRKSSRSLHLKTDASARFEKGLDSLFTEKALEYACSMLHEIAGATIEENGVKITPHPFIFRKIKLRKERVSTLLGIDLTIETMVELFLRLGIRTTSQSKECLDLIIPSHRNDLHIEADLIEELARLYGYNNLPRHSCLYTGSTLIDASLFQAENFVRDRLIASGLQEFITCDLLSPDLALATSEPTRKDLTPLKVMHAKSQDYSVLRSSLLTGLLSSAKRNIDQQISSLSAFEIGRVHFQEKQSIEERTHIGIIITGNTRPYHHSPRPDDVDFFDLKGIIENLFQSMHTSKAIYEVSHLHTLQPGHQAAAIIENQKVAFFGKVHPHVLKSFGIKQPVFYAEIDLHTLEKYIHTPMQCSPLPLYPSSERDWTISLLKHLSLGRLYQAIEENRTAVLSSFFLLDIYENEKIGIDTKNVTLRFCYRSHDKTLSYEEVEKEHAALLEKVKTMLQIF